MVDSMNALLGGTPGPEGQVQDGADPLADLLGGMLGGGSGSSSSGVGGLLETILGAGSGSESGGGTDMGDILGAIMGGAGASPATSQDSFLGPIVTALSDKIGISPEIASMVVTFLLGKLMSGMAGSGVSAAADSPGATPIQDDLELDHLLTAMRSGEPVDADYIEMSGMCEELAAKTGMDPATATASLQEALTLLGGQMSSGAESPEPAEPDLDGLSNLLDTW